MACRRARSREPERPWPRADRPGCDRCSPRSRPPRPCRGPWCWGRWRGPRSWNPSRCCCRRRSHPCSAHRWNAPARRRGRRRERSARPSMPTRYLPPPTRCSPHPPLRPGAHRRLRGQREEWRCRRGWHRRPEIDEFASLLDLSGRGRGPPTVGTNYRTARRFCYSPMPTRPLVGTARHTDPGHPPPATLTGTGGGRGMRTLGGPRLNGFKIDLPWRIAPSGAVDVGLNTRGSTVEVAGVVCPRHELAGRAWGAQAHAVVRADMSLTGRATLREARCVSRL